MKNKFLPYIFISMIFFILYRWGSFLKIPFGDCIGQVLDTEKGAFILKNDSTTHFLYANSLILLKKIIPFIDSITLCRYFTIIFAVVVLNLLYYIIFDLTQQRLSALIGTFCFGLSFSFWRNAEIIEVYTFNLFFVALHILFVIKSLIRNPKYAVHAGVVLGISLWCHIQNILLIPSYVFLLWCLYSKNFSKIMANLGIVIIFFLSLYIEPIINKESIVEVLSSTDFTWVGDSFKKGAIDYAGDLLKSIGYLIYNFWYFIFFIALGMKYIFKENPKLFWFFVIFSVPVYGFATVYAVSDNYVFYLNCYLIFAVFIGLGCFYLQLFYKSNKIWAITGILLIPFLYSISKYMVTKTQKGQEFSARKEYKGGLDYYLTPWMNNNIGIIEFTLERRESSDPLYWMTGAAQEFVELRKKKNPDENVNKL